jgi:hypothetical protein
MCRSAWRVKSDFRLGFRMVMIGFALRHSDSASRIGISYVECGSASDPAAQYRAEDE